MILTFRLAILEKFEETRGNSMKNKSLFLLLAFMISLLPLNIVQAETVPQHTLDDAISLMYISDAVLLDEDFPDETLRAPGLLSPVSDDPVPQSDNAILAGMINAAKAMRNDLDANCQLMTNRYRQQGKDCEADLLQTYCTERKAKINEVIGALHKERGDRRRPFTKFWHSIKRSSRGFWHKIGPVGRNFLRKTGPEVLKVVATGGTLNIGVVKTIFKHQVKSVIRDHVKQVVLKGVQRLMQGQIEIAQAAGVDICEEQEKEVSQDEGSDDTNNSSEVVEYINIPRVWTCSSNIGPYGTWMQSDGSIIDKSDLVFNLDASNPSPSYEFSFEGIARIPSSGDYALAEEFFYGIGSATWDKSNYFYGSVDIERTSSLTYPHSEKSEQIDTWERAVIGALSPDQKEIHICFHVHTKDQFDYIKNEPFENLLEHCSSFQYFVCTPQE